MSRVDKVQALLRQEISRIVQTRLDDGRIGFVTITEIKVTTDIKQAKVFFSVIGDMKTMRKTRDGLQSAARYIKGELGRVLHMQTIPDLIFIYDDSLAKGSDLVQKINKLDDQ